MAQLSLYASEIAIITRHNTYQNISDYKAKLWQKYFPNDYDKHLKLFEEKNNVELVQHTPEELLKLMASQHNIKIDKCFNASNVQDLQESKKEVIEKFTEKLDSKTLQVVKKCVQDSTNTNFGTKHEEHSRLKYNKNVKTTNKFFKIPFKTTKKFDWFLGGKIDGIDEDGDTIVEIKNRVNRLFYKLRDYEKVQTMIYMKLLNKTKSRLVETLKKKGDTQMNVIEVSWDQDFWDNEIEPKLNSFIDDFEKFLRSPKQKAELLNELF